MVPTDAATVDLFEGTPITAGDEPLAAIGRLADAGEPGTIADAGQPDAISETVGRPGYLSPYTEPECLLAVEHRREPAVFDRYYFSTGEGGPVYVDTVPGGRERASQEAEKHVAAKRAWCKKRGAKYVVFVETTVTV
jgi:hypothetical protein